MYIKTILLATLIVLSSAYTEEGNVLVLTDDDFPAVLSEFSHLLIEFYAPWCGHCKQLAPIYAEVANELKAQESVVRVAKVDATEHGKAAGQYGVRGYPTLFFFYNGEKMDYSGQRTKDSMVNWLLKKTRDPVVEIDAEKYATLSSAKGVSIVYHGDFSSAQGSSLLTTLATADDYNTYYWGKDLGKEEGTLEMIRDFDSTIVYSGLDEGIKAWIGSNQRPLVVNFDERTIGDMFGSGKMGLVLFNGASSNVALDALIEAAKEYDGVPLVFTEIKSGNEHLENFANYIKINHNSHPIILVDSGSQKKYVMNEEPTKDNILSFLSNYNAFEFGLTDQVKFDETEKDVTDGDL